MRLYLSQRDIEVLRKAISLLETEYEGAADDDGNMPPQAPEDFWRDLEAAETKLKVAQRRQRR